MTERGLANISSCSSVSRGDGNEMWSSSYSVDVDDHDAPKQTACNPTNSYEERLRDGFPRKRQRRVMTFKLPRRIFTIFYGEGLPRSRTIEVLHEFPRVYKISNFLRKDQLSYFDQLCRSKSTEFQHSFTEDSSGAEVISEERTSRYKSFVKQENKIISLIEKKAADVVGLSVDCVEPLQLVMYSAGQFFGEHHDAGKFYFGASTIVFTFRGVGTLAEDDAIELIHPRRLVTFFAVNLNASCVLYM